MSLVELSQAPFAPACMPTADVRVLLGCIPGEYEYTCPECGRVGRFQVRPTVEDGRSVHHLAGTWVA